MEKFNPTGSYLLSASLFVAGSVFALLWVPIFNCDDVVMVIVFLMLGIFMSMIVQLVIFQKMALKKQGLYRWVSRLQMVLWGTLAGAHLFTSYSDHFPVWQVPAMALTLMMAATYSFIYVRAMKHMSK